MGPGEANAILECMAIDMAEAMSGLTETMPLMDVVRQRLNAIKVAQSALRPVSREQVERMAGEWVQDINKGPAVFYCSSCGESFEIHSYEFQKYRFCPFCMSPMTDEAEEMVMERMEALHHE